MTYAPGKMPKVTYRCHKEHTQLWKPFKFPALAEQTLHLILAPKGLHDKQAVRKWQSIVVSENNDPLQNSSISNLRKFTNPLYQSYKYHVFVGEI
jgi:hypothetical protein